jgi:hypothetical protein
VNWRITVIDIVGNPFQEHAENVADYQDMLKGDDNSGGAKLTFPTIPNIPAIDCTFDRIQDDFNQIAGGQSPRLLIEGCKFLASDIPDADKPSIRKGLKCNLLPNPSAKVVACELWVGGLEQGGLIYRFMLRDTNYGA